MQWCKIGDGMYIHILSNSYGYIDTVTEREKGTYFEEFIVAYLKHGREA